MAAEKNSDETDLPNIGLAGEVLTPGEKFGDYQVLQCLSFGLLGGIYFMEHIREFSEICLIVLPTAVNQDEEFETRFEDWTKKLLKLDHPNILKVTGTCKIKDRFCIVLDPFEGENLNDYLGQYTRKKLSQAGQKIPSNEIRLGAVKAEELLHDQAFGLPPSEVKIILKKTGDAARAAQDQGIHHFNLNPTTILRDKEGGIKVVGFGLFEIVGSELFEYLVSAGIPPIMVGTRRIVVNTIDTLSPEMRDGADPDSRSDVFALGYSGYYLLTGHKPTSTPRTPSAYSPTISKYWDSLILKSLEKDPAERYATFKAFLNEMEKMEKRVTAAPFEEQAIARQIEKIPLPKHVKKRFSGRILQFIRLGLLGLMGAIAVGLGAVSYLVIFSEDTAPEGPVVRRVKPGENPILMMKVDPPLSRVTFRGDSPTSMIITDGLLQVTMPPGNYNIRIEAADYVAKTLNLQVAREQIRVPFKLSKAWAILEVMSDPGATVVAVPDKGDPVLVGTIPADGVLLAEKKIVVGTYEIVISKANFKRYTFEALQLPLNNKVNCKIDLEPLPATITFLSQPEGGVVYINDEEKGTTPFEAENLPVRTEVTFRIVLDKHRDVGGKVTFEPGYKGTVDFGKLIRRTGDLRLEIDLIGQKPSDTDWKVFKIRVDGKEVQASGNRLQALDAGERAVEIEHPDYFTWSHRVAVKDGVTETQIVQLRPKPGLLTINAQPEIPFQLLANGKEQKQANSVFELPTGTDLLLELRVKEHMTVKRSIYMDPNQKMDWSVSFQPIPGPQVGEDWDVPYVGVSTVWVPGGQFTMGSEMTEQSRLPSEGPRTIVNFQKGFWLGKTEVTQSQYAAVMQTNPSRFKGGDKPVEQVNWSQAMEFCRRINEQEKSAGRLPEAYDYRLPTEAEWEFAARAGSDTPFFFGQEADSSQGNFKGFYPREYENEATDSSGLYGSVDVGQYEPNKFGLYDMHGNVREWCFDRFNSRLPGGEKENWAGPDLGEDRVHRGGGWSDFAHRCRSGARDRMNPTTTSGSTGFRLILGPVIEKQ